MEYIRVMKGRRYFVWIWLCIALCLSTMGAYSAPYSASVNSIARFDQIQAKINTPATGILFENNVDFSFLTDVESTRFNWGKGAFGFAANWRAESDLNLPLFRRFEVVTPQSKFLILIFPFHAFW